MKNTRSYNLDVLRIIATLMVIMIHVSGSFMIKMNDANFASFFGRISASAVPLFFMISGALFLEPNKDISIKGLLSRILSILIVMFAWNFIYALMDNWNNMSMYEMVKDTWKGHFHFWFFEYLIGVYLLIPVLKGLVEYKNGKFIKYYLIVFILFGIIRTTLNAIPYYNDEIRIITDKFHVELCDFCGYFVAGYYVSKTRLKINNYLLILVFVSSIGLYYTIINVLNVKLIGVLAFTIFVFVEASTLFLLSKNLITNVRNPHLVTTISKATLGVYLIHPLFFEYIIPVSVFDYISVYYAFPLYFVVIVSMSFGSSLILNKIPYVNKWLV